MRVDPRLSLVFHNVSRRAVKTPRGIESWRKTAEKSRIIGQGRQEQDIIYFKRTFSGTGLRRAIHQRKR